MTPIALLTAPPNPPAPPTLAYAMSVAIELTNAFETAPTPGGERIRQHAVLSGTFDGPHAAGVVVPGGGESIALRVSMPAAGSSSFVLKTDDGELIRLRLASTGTDISDSAVGEFTAVATFDTPPGTYEHLSRRLFLGVGKRTESALEIRIHAID